MAKRDGAAQPEPGSPAPSPGRRADATDAGTANARRRSEATRDHLQAALVALETMDVAAPATAREAALTALRAAVAENDGFCQTVAHDLRNPLAAIRGQVQLLRRRSRQSGTLGGDPVHLDQGLRSIDAAVDLALGVIDRSLDPQSERGQEDGGAEMSGR